MNISLKFKASYELLNDIFEIKNKKNLILNCSTKLKIFVLEMYVITERLFNWKIYQMIFYSTN